jgi:hypothetical protein
MTHIADAWGTAGIPIFDEAENFYARLCDGTADQFALVTMADDGNRAADLALRRYAADFMDRGRWAELSTQVRAYVVRVLVKPFLHPDDFYSDEEA